MFFLLAKKLVANPSISIPPMISRGRSCLHHARLLHTSRRTLGKKTPKAAMPARESMDLDDGKMSNVVVSTCIILTLGLGSYLDSKDYMHARDQGVVQATPAPLRFIVNAIQNNVPGAYEKRT